MEFAIAFNYIDDCTKKIMILGSQDKQLPDFLSHLCEAKGQLLLLPQIGMASSGRGMSNERSTMRLKIN